MIANAGFKRINGLGLRGYAGLECMRYGACGGWAVVSWEAVGGRGRLRRLLGVVESLLRMLMIYVPRHFLRRAGVQVEEARFMAPQ